MTHMAITDDDRDERGRIVIGRSLAELLPEQTAPVEGAAPPLATPRPAFRWKLTRSEMVSVAITALVLAAWVASEWLRPVPSTAHQAPVATAAPTVAPTIIPTPLQQTAYASPDGAQLGTIPLTATVTYQHSAYPGWAGVQWQGAIVWVQTKEETGNLIDLAPPPTVVPRPPAPPIAPVVVPPARACDPMVNPIFVIEQDVTGPKGEPLGHVRGVSCNSQEEAQANADSLAAQVRATP